MVKQAKFVGRDWTWRTDAQEFELSEPFQGASRVMVSRVSASQNPFGYAETAVFAWDDERGDWNMRGVFERRGEVSHDEVLAEMGYEVWC